MVTDAQAPWLAPFLCGSGPGLEASELPGPFGTAGRVVYSGVSIVAGRERAVRCMRSDLGFILEMEGFRPVHVSQDGDQITRLAPLPLPPGDPEIEALFGPAFILSLALKGVFCLHASALELGHPAAFLGPSGAGKSTLARIASESRRAVRLSDDVLPVTVFEGAVLALPGYPQLKLGIGEQWGSDRPEGVLLQALYVLSVPGVPAPGGGAAEILLLTRRDAVLSLARHTVASRLFDRDLTERHLRFCEDVASRIPVQALGYPRSLDVLPDVFTAIDEDLRARYGGAPSRRTISDVPDLLPGRTTPSPR